MKLATIHVTGVEVLPVNVKKIPRGIIGAVVEFQYEDCTWNDLIKNVVFEGFETVVVADAGDVVPFPAEVAAAKNVNVRAGVTGVSKAGNVVIPTLWADLGAVQDSPMGEFPSAQDQEAPFWAQLQQDLAAVEEQLEGKGIQRIVEEYLAANPPSAAPITINGEKPDPGGNFVINTVSDVEIAQLAAALT